MHKAGGILLAIGVILAVAGTAQFLIVVALSSDPNPNPVGNGILMWLGWLVGGVFAALGLAILGASFLRGERAKKG